MKNRKGDDWYPFWIDKWLFGSTRFELEPAERSVWADLLTLSKKDEGNIRANDNMPYPPEYLAHIFNVPIVLLNKTIEKCIKVNKLRRLPNGALFVVSEEMGNYDLSGRHKRRIDNIINQQKKEEEPISSYTVEQCRDTALIVGLEQTEADSFYEYMAAQNWKWPNGLLVGSLPAALARWKRNRPRFENNNNEHNGKMRLFPIAGHNCSKTGCKLPAVYRDTSGNYDSYYCSEHLPESVKEKYQ